MERTTKKKIAKIVTVAAAGMALTVMVGKIVPINLIDAVCHSNYSTNQLFVAEECCGPYHQCECPSFKGAS